MRSQREGPPDKEVGRPGGDQTAEAQQTTTNIPAKQNTPRYRYTGNCRPVVIDMAAPCPDCGHDRGKVLAFEGKYAIRCLDCQRFCYYTARRWMS